MFLVVFAAIIMSLAIGGALVLHIAKTEKQFVDNIYLYLLLVALIQAFFVTLIYTIEENTVQIVLNI